MQYALHYSFQSIASRYPSILLYSYSRSIRMRRLDSHTRTGTLNSRSIGMRRLDSHTRTGTLSGFVLTDSFPWEYSIISIVDH